MTDANDIKLAVAPGTAEAFAAAFARIQQVATGGTLIDRMSREQWLCESTADWNVNCGSSGSDAEELDEVDIAAARAA